MAGSSPVLPHPPAPAFPFCLPTGPHSDALSFVKPSLAFLHGPLRPCVLCDANLGYSIFTIFKSIFVIDYISGKPDYITIIYLFISFI